MKSLYIFNANVRGAWYGVGTYIDQLAKCVNSTDITVNLIEMNASVDRLTVETRNNVRYISIPSPVVNTSKAIHFRQYLETVQCYMVYLLKDYISEQDDNIFHLNRMGSLSLAKKLKEHFNGKIVLTMHYTNWSLSLSGDKNRLRKIMYSEREFLLPTEKEVYDEVIEGRELLNNYCDKVIAISEHSYRDLVSVYRVPKNKVVLINNALQDCYHSISVEKNNKTRDDFHISPHEKVLMYAGRVDRIKGVFILAEAFNRVLKKHPECRLIIAGSGQVEAVMALTGYNNSKITYMGFIPKKTLNKLYSIADIGIIPSIHEEFGYVALEMMMHKLPTVVSDTTGLKEIIEDGADGLRVSIKKESGRFHQSAKNLAEKINRLIENCDLRQQYGVAARKKYLSKYGSSLFRRRMMELYNSLT